MNLNKRNQNGEDFEIKPMSRTCSCAYACGFTGTPEYADVMTSYQESGEWESSNKLPV